ncbi:hypothetical protein RJT34_28055 [Clitoria ternatea]|uniref:Uncharacterized protein n=1 Tax=Clitoria ternatea TaxID=43366 RepID=A0AAN9FAM6_CLITE
MTPLLLIAPFSTALIIAFSVSLFSHQLFLFAPLFSGHPRRKITPPIFSISFPLIVPSNAHTLLHSHYIVSTLPFLFPCCS